jgi:hypothetical protein
MELDEVVTMEDGRMLVREATPLERFAPELRAEGQQLVLRPRSTLAP